MSQASQDPDFVLAEGTRQLALLCDSHPNDHERLFLSERDCRGGASVCSVISLVIIVCGVDNRRIHLILVVFVFILRKKVCGCSERKIIPDALCRRS